LQEISQANEEHQSRGIKQAHEVSLAGKCQGASALYGKAVILSEYQVLQPEDFLFSIAPADDEGIIFDSYNLELVEKIVIRRAIDKHKGTSARQQMNLLGQGIAFTAGWKNTDSKCFSNL